MPKQQLGFRKFQEVPALEKRPEQIDFGDGIVFTASKPELSPF